MDGFDSLPSLGLDGLGGRKQPSQTDPAANGARMPDKGDAGLLPPLLGSTALIPSRATGQPRPIYEDVEPEPLTASVSQALKGNPDDRARAMSLADETGLPKDLVERNLDSVERDRRFKALDLDGLKDRNLKTAAYLVDLDRASVAVDDIGVLERLEQAWNGVRKFGSDVATAYGEGEATVELSEIGMDRLSAHFGFSDPVSDDRLARAKALRKREQAKADYGFFGDVAIETARTLPTTIKTLGTGAKGAAGGAVAGSGTALLLGQLGPQVAVPEELLTVPGGAILGGRTGFKVGAAWGAFQLEAGLAFDEYSEISDGDGNALDPDIAAGAAVSVGAVNAGLEMFSLTALLDTIPGGKRLLGLVGRQGMKKALQSPTVRRALAGVAKRYATSAATEGVTESAQEMSLMIGGGIAKMIQGGNFEEMTAEEFWTRALEAGEAGFKAGLGLGAPGSVVSAAVEVRKAKRAQAHAERVAETLDAAKDSKLRERAPAAFEDFMNGLDTDGNGEVLVSARPVAEFLQEAGADPVTFFDELGVSGDRLNEALATGGDVGVKAGRFASRLAGHEHRDAVLANVREDVGALTMTEAERAFAEAQDLSGEDLAIIAREEDARGASGDKADMVYEQVLQKLRDAGAYDEEGARAAAELYRQHARTLSEAFAAEGKAFDPLAFFSGYGVDIRPGEETRGAALVDGLDVLLEELRNPRLRKREADLFGPSLLEFLSDKGLSRKSLEELGVLGDVMGLGPDAFHRAKPGRRALVRDDAGALNIDDAALSAWERGYFPEHTERPDVNTLLEAVREELAGNLRHSEQNVDANAVAREELLANLEAALGELGLDVGAADNASIKAELAQAFDQADLRQGPVAEFAQAAKRDKVKRGSISFADGETVVRLFKDANPSTFLHESGHLFLKMMADVAGRDDAPARIKTDFDTVRAWLGVENAADLEPSLNGEAAIEAHEKWARGFEEYLKSGKAPSAELHTAFARFKAWLSRIYSALKGTGVTINDEIEGVFDRMLATDAQIAQAEEASLYKVSPAMSDLLTDGERTALEEAALRAHDEAAAELATKVRNAEIRETKKWWKAESAKVREEVEADVWGRQIYRAWKDLTAQGGDKLSLPALKEHYGPGVSKLLPKSVPPIATNAGTLHPDDLAVRFGFAGGDEFVHALLNMEPPRKVIEAEVRRIMTERHGDPLNDGSIETAAIEAVHSDQRAVFLAGELRALARKAGERPTPRDVIKAAVERIFAEKPVGELLKPLRYQQDSLRAARDAERALAAEDYRAAFEAKRRQLLNHELFRRALKAKGEADGITKYLRRLQAKRIDPKRVDPEHVARVKEILEAYQFGPALSQGKRVALMLEATKEWMEAQIEDKNAQLVIPPRILDANNLTNWRDMPLEDLKGLRDVVKSLMKAGRENSEAERDSFRHRTEALAQGIRDNVKERGDAGAVFGRHSLGARAKRLGRQFLAEHRKLESLVRELDGFEDLGPMHQAIFQPLADAADVKAEMAQMAINELDRIFGRYSQAERMTWGTTKLGAGVFVPEVGETITKEERLAVALNWGNEGNRDALMRGNGWSANQVEAILKHLDAKDWETVQAIWDLVDGYWPDIAKLEKETTGVVPERVAPTGFETPHGQKLRGGYYPLKYDAERDVRTARDTIEEQAKRLLQGGHSRAATRHGHTNERVGSGGRPVKLSLGVLMRHLEEVTHDLAYRKAVREADGLLRSSAVAEAITATKSREAFDAMEGIVTLVAAGNMDPLSSVEKAFKHLRLGVTTSTMGFNLRTVLTQPLGLTQSIARIGPAAVAKGIVRFYGRPGHMAEIVDLVNEKSGMMRERRRVFNREVAEKQSVIDASGPHKQLQAVGFWGLVAMDMYAVAYPTWIGAYEQGMAKFDGDEAKAIKHADSAVRLTQGLGDAQNMALIQQGKEWRKWLTLFYGYFSTTHNMMAELFRKTDFRRPADWPRFIGEFAMIQTVPAILSALVLEAWPDDDEEDAMTRFLLASMVNQLTAGFVIARDFGSSVTSGWGYSLSPVARAGELATNVVRKTGEAIEEGEIPDTLPKDAARLVGILLHIPGMGQLLRSGGYLSDLEEGDVDDPGLKGALLTGNRK